MSSDELEYYIKFNKQTFLKVVRHYWYKLKMKEYGIGKLVNYTIYTYKNDILSETNKKVRKIWNYTLGERYEAKERISKDFVTEFDYHNYTCKLFCKVAKETPITENLHVFKDKTIDNVSRIIRLTLKDKYFKIELSVRYILNNPTGGRHKGEECERKAKMCDLNIDNFLNAPQIPGWDQICDVEFEVYPEYTKQILEDGNSELKKRIEFAILQSLTGRNYQLDDIISNYSRSPQVVSLTNEILQNSKQEDFVSLVKTDGVRNLLVFIKTEDGKIEIHRWNSISSGLIDTIELKKKEPSIKNSSTKSSMRNLSMKDSEEIVAILDCEQITNPKTTLPSDLPAFDYYYIFDVYNVYGDVRELPFKERMNKAREIKKIFENQSKIDHSQTSFDKSSNNQPLISQLGEILTEYTNSKGIHFKLILKNYNETVNFNELIENYNKLMPSVKESVKDKSIDVEFDGTILQLKVPYQLAEVQSIKGKVFDVSKYYSFKVKPLILNTIDFKLKNENTKKLPAYAIKPQEINPIYKLYLIGNNLESTYNLREVSRDKTTDRNVDILFETPFYEQTYIYDARDDKTPIAFGRRFDLPKNLDLNNVIAEMSWKDGKWHLHRIRTDKTKPNGYRVGLSNISLFFDPLMVEGEYYHTELKTFPLKFIDEFHDCSRKVRDINYGRLKEILTDKGMLQRKQINYLDVAGGRGGEAEYIIKMLKSVDKINLFATDISSTGLVRYVYKVQKLSVQYQKEINFNVIAEGNGTTKQNNKLLNEIVKRKEFNKFDVINMSFAIHYISDHLKEFVSFCEELLADDYVIMLTFYDSEMLLKNINGFKIFKDIKIDLDKNEAWMPLPTISDSGYRAEPCMSNKHVEILKSLGRCEEFYPFQGKSTPNSDIRLYYSCIKTLIISNRL